MVEMPGKRIYVCALMTLLFGMRGDVRVERLIAATQRPAANVNQYLNAYHRLTLDARQIEQQVRSTGRFSIAGLDGRSTWLWNRTTCGARTLWPRRWTTRALREDSSARR